MGIDTNGMVIAKMLGNHIGKSNDEGAAVI